jgi:hypothetical protein
MLRFYADLSWLIYSVGYTIYIMKHKNMTTRNLDMVRNYVVISVQATQQFADSWYGSVATLQPTHLRLVELSGAVCENTTNWSGVIRETAQIV